MILWMDMNELLVEEFPRQSTLTIVLSTRSRMFTGDMDVFILPLTRPCTSAQTVPQNMSKEKPGQLFSQGS